MKKSMKNKLLALVCMGTTLAAGVSVWNMAVAKTEIAAATEGAATFACAGASIRLDADTADGDKTGIRFRVKMDTATYQTLEQAGTEIKILVMPTDLIGDDNELTVADTDAREETLTDWRDFVNDDGLTTNSNYKQAYAYTYGMTEAEWNRPTTWRAYYLDGNNEPVYSDQMERSLSEVALSLENDMKESDTRRDKARDYILSYTVTYDHGVRDTDGAWKTTTQTVRYGTELTELPTAPTLDTREDFEFLAWETTKGADKIKTKNEKTIITGNVTKEAYWLLTGSMDINSVETMNEYADFTPTTYANGSAVSTVSDTQNGLTFQSEYADVNASSKFIYMDWKNICVPANLVYRMEGKQTTTQRTSDSLHGTLDVNFETKNGKQSLYIANQTAFDNFGTFDSTKFTAYGEYYVLGDFYATGNAVTTKHTTSFANFQIQSADYYEDDEKREATAIDFLGGATHWQMDPGNSNSDGAASYSDNKAWLTEDYLAVKAGGVSNNREPLKVYYNNVALAQNDTIVITLKTEYTIFVGLNTDWDDANFTFNGGSNTTANEEFVSYVLTANKAVTLTNLQFRAPASNAVDFVIQSIEINPETRTGNAPLRLAGISEGPKTVAFGGPLWMTPKVEFGTDSTYGDYVKYTFNQSFAWGENALSFDFGGITLNPGDTVHLCTYTGENSRWPYVDVNGINQTYLTKGQTENKVVFTATETTILNTVSIRPQTYGAGYYFDITIYDLYIERAN